MEKFDVAANDSGLTWQSGWGGNPPLSTLPRPRQYYVWSILLILSHYAGGSSDLAAMVVGACGDTHEWVPGVGATTTEDSHHPPHRHVPITMPVPWSMKMALPIVAPGWISTACGDSIGERHCHAQLGMIWQGRRRGERVGRSRGQCAGRVGQGVRDRCRVPSGGEHRHS